MSVTFSVYADGKFVVPEGWVEEYEDDPMYGRIAVNQNPLELNVANGNYVRIMELIGLDSSEYCGTWGDGSLQYVADRIRVCLDGLQGIPELDAGIPDRVERSHSGFTVVHCGVSEGYFGERLASLLAIVNKAIEVGGVVTFG